jgi:hypothetical protein
MSGAEIEWVCQDCGITRGQYDGTLVKKTSGSVLCLECDLDEEDPDDNFEQNLFEVACDECETVWLTPERHETELCLECAE